MPVYEDEPAQSRIENFKDLLSSDNKLNLVILLLVVILSMMVYKFFFCPYKK